MPCPYPPHPSERQAPFDLELHRFTRWSRGQAASQSGSLPQGQRGSGTIETRWAEGYRFIGPCEEAEPPPAGRSGTSAVPVACGAGAAELEEAWGVVGTIYDAALDHERWPEALQRIAGFVGGAAAALTSHDVASHQGRFHSSWGDDPHYTRLYFEKYIRLNPAFVPIMLLEVGEVRTVSTLLPAQEFRSTRFYQEWAGPAGYGDNTAAVIEKSASVVTFLGVSHRDEQSPAGPGARRRMELIAPHVRRAVAIGNIIDRQRIEADDLARAIDAIAAGLFLIRDDGKVVHANASGRALLKAGDLLRLEHGSLAARRAVDEQVLAATITGAIEGELVVRPRGVAVALSASDGARYVAHVLPLSSRRHGRGPAGAAAAVFVHEAALTGPLPLELLARQYGLSAGELRVLVAMLEVGGRVRDIAPVLGIAEPTVKTHLRRLLAKTGAKRQPDLIKLVAGYSSPLLRPP